MKIVTLNPTFLKNFSREARSPAVAKSGTLYYPIWLAYATGYLEKNGHCVNLIDAIADELSENATIQKVSELQPDMVVIDTSTPSIYNDIDIATKIKKTTPSQLCHTCRSSCFRLSNGNIRSRSGNRCDSIERI